jgi:type VI secretion system protein ImpF
MVIVHRQVRRRRMPDTPPPQDRLQPALLDRLTDDFPDREQEARDQRVMSRRQLREAVLRDLAWLFNATRLDAAVPLDKLPLVRRSVVNFGLPSLSGQTASTVEIVDLERALRQAILDFEPRILAPTLRVKALVEGGHLDLHNVIGVEIHGQMWAQPVPIELLIRTEIDLETGKVQIADLAPGRVA